MNMSAFNLARILNFYWENFGELGNQSVSVFWGLRIFYVDKPGGTVSWNVSTSKRRFFISVCPETSLISPQIYLYQFTQQNSHKSNFLCRQP